MNNDDRLSFMLGYLMGAKDRLPADTVWFGDDGSLWVRDSLMFSGEGDHRTDLQCWLDCLELAHRHGEEIQHFYLKFRSQLP